MKESPFQTSVRVHQDIELAIDLDKMRPSEKDPPNPVMSKVGGHTKIA
jgi:hypothetical protein